MPERVGDREQELGGKEKKETESRDRFTRLWPGAGIKRGCNGVQKGGVGKHVVAGGENGSSGQVDSTKL